LIKPNIRFSHCWPSIFDHLSHCQWFNILNFKQDLFSCIRLNIGRELNFRLVPIFYNEEDRRLSGRRILNQ
jgi:hypothetical protein